MAKRGRPRKAGRRTRSGRLARSVEPKIVKGNDRAEARKALFGANATDAIGRVYERGFLGSDGQVMLDTARAIFRAYWAWYAIGVYKCPLADRTGSSAATDAERERRQEDWLNSMLRIRDRYPFDARRLFDQLVIDLNPDEGPAWVDRLVSRNGTPADSARLAAALEILAECAGIGSRVVVDKAA